MKNVILILAFTSSVVMACGTMFPAKLECRNPNVADDDISFEFERLESGKVEMRVYQQSFAGPKLLVTEELKSKRYRLKSRQYKAKFSKDFKVLKRFKSKGDMSRSHFTCL